MKMNNRTCLKLTVRCAYRLPYPNVQEFVRCKFNRDRPDLGRRRDFIEVFKIEQNHCSACLHTHLDTVDVAANLCKVYRRNHISIRGRGLLQLFLIVKHNEEIGEAQY